MLNNDGLAIRDHGKPHHILSAEELEWNKLLNEDTAAASAAEASAAAAARSSMEVETETSGAPAPSAAAVLEARKDGYRDRSTSPSSTSPLFVETDDMEDMAPSRAAQRLAIKDAEPEPEPGRRDISYDVFGFARKAMLSQGVPPFQETCRGSAHHCNYETQFFNWNSRTRKWFPRCAPVDIGTITGSGVQLFTRKSCTLSAGLRVRSHFSVAFSVAP